MGAQPTYGVQQPVCADQFVQYAAQPATYQSPVSYAAPHQMQYATHAMPHVMEQPAVQPVSYMSHPYQGIAAPQQIPEATPGFFHDPNALYHGNLNAMFQAPA